jgi:integrase
VVRRHDKEVEAVKGTIRNRGGKLDARGRIRGGTWYYQYPVIRGDQRRQVTKGGYRTRAEAEDALAVALTEHQQGTHVEPTKRTVHEYLEREWLPLQKAARKPSTYVGYEFIVEKRIVPELGDPRLSELTAGDVARLYTTLRATGRLAGKAKGTGISERSIKHTHSVLHSTLEHAVDAGKLARNPARRLPRASQPNPRNAEMKTWTADELRAFFAAVDGDRLRPAFVVAALTGVRRSELCGLRWEDVDLDRQVLAVRRGLVTAGYAVHEGEPKSGRARTVALEAETVAVFRRHRAAQLEDRLAGGESWVDSGYVFTRETGEPFHPQLLSDAFERRVRNAAGVPVIRFHDLRHTHATLLLAAGVHPKVVQERLGHSSISITLDLYSHVAPGMQEDAAAKLGALVFG